MKALSIRQPWAWAILYAGKDVENRDWNLHTSIALQQARNLANSGERFLIHASSGITRAEYEDFLDDYLGGSYGFQSATLPPMQNLPRGGIVGTARIAAIVTESTSPWFFGPIGLVLADVRPTKFVPFKGALGFFNVPDTIAQEAQSNDR